MQPGWWWFRGSPGSSITSVDPGLRFAGPMNFWVLKTPTKMCVGWFLLVIPLMCSMLPNRYFVLYKLIRCLLYKCSVFQKGMRIWIDYHMILNGVAPSPTGYNQTISVFYVYHTLQPDWLVRWIYHKPNSCIYSNWKHLETHLYTLSNMNILKSILNPWCLGEIP